MAEEPGGFRKSTSNTPGGGLSLAADHGGDRQELVVQAGGPQPYVSYGFRQWWKAKARDDTEMLGNRVKI
jgi:hypothetical protein